MKIKIKFGRTCSKSSETVASIDHLLTCILLRLPMKYYIYNPTTTKFSTLPKLECVSRNISGMNLGFDPAKSHHYKAVCVSGVGPYKYQIELYSYSSERGPWRKCGQPFALSKGAHINFTEGVYWNGSIYWLNIGHSDSLYFNIENEMSGSFSSPPHQQWDRMSGFYFGESCGHLHYMDMCRGQVEFDVYEMKRDYSEWFVKYKVDLGGVVASYPEMNTILIVGLFEQYMNTQLQRMK